MKSAIYEGRVYHERITPRPHSFEKSVFFLHLDLEELDRVFEGRWLWSTKRTAVARWRREDYMGPVDRPLREAVLDRVESELGRRPCGSVTMLTQIRTWGYLFNPVTFYYCYDSDDQLAAVAAEITNTPWGERHTYVLGASESEAEEGIEARFEKNFHVSPFFPMEQSYHWRFPRPGENAQVHMTNSEGGRDVFHAGLNCRRKPITGWNLARALVRFPFQTLRIHAAIYIHAALLWAKRTPFFTHPKKRDPLNDAIPS